MKDVAGLGKKEALREFHQSTIARVADELFQENGVEKTTMEDIARKGDYSKATLYVYFKSKEDIYHYIVLNAMKLLRDAIGGALGAEGNAIELYTGVCGAVAEFSNQYPFYFESLMKTIAVDPDTRQQNPLLEEIYNLGEEINHKIGGLLQAGVEQGYFRQEANRLETVFLFWAAISGVAQLASNKQAYIGQRMGLTKDEFLEFSFSTLLRAIVK